MTLSVIVVSESYSALGIADTSSRLRGNLVAGELGDWGVYQLPGAFEEMQRGACKRLFGVHLTQGAGHWMAEEQPQQVNQLLIDFLRRTATAPSRT
jgi:hypothetical protein